MPAAPALARVFPVDAAVVTTTAGSAAAAGLGRVRVRRRSCWRTGAWRSGSATASATPIGRLPNPENVVVDRAAALQRLAFDVTTELDARPGGVHVHGGAAGVPAAECGGVVSLVFYAGYGIDMDGVNSLVPVDARLEHDARYETVMLQTLVAYAPAAGTTAADGRGRNSPLRGGAAVTHLETPLEIGLLVPAHAGRGAGGELPSHGLTPYVGARTLRTWMSSPSGSVRP